MAHHTTAELESLIAAAVSLTDRIALKNSLAYTLRNNNPQQALVLCKENYEDAVDLGHPRSVVETLYTLGVAYTCLPNFESALQYLFDALENSRTSLLPDIEMKILRWLGIVYSRTDVQVMALDYFHQSHILAEKLEDFAYAAQSLRNMGAIYMSSYQEYERAIEYLSQAWQYQEMSGETDKLELGVTLRNLGELYMSMKDYDKAEEKFALCIVYFESVHDLTGLNITRMKLAEIAYERGNVTEAFRIYSRVLREAYRYNNWSGKIWVNLAIGILFNKQCKSKKALPYLHEALLTAESLSLSGVQADIHEQFAVAYEFLKQEDKALHHLYQHIALKKKTMTEELKQVRTNLQKGFELERAQQEAEIYRLKNVELARMNDENEKLLLNVLPGPIARRLKDGETLIAESFDNVSVLFADIVGFTKLSSQHPPAEVVSLLNRIFSAFDVFSEQYRLEKIKTIGDAYMIVGGVPIPSADNAKAVALMALEMLKTIELLSKTLNSPLQVRIGIHIGEVVAGIIGQKKFSYDLWGDTVNTASRMESHGFPGMIHCTEEVYHALHDEFTFEPRGVLDVKGKGFMRTYFLKGVKSK